ncbi:MAG TPA: hypothetical protein VH040_04730 [Usitatibacter sp.]|jgi:hypothetical protein|nr:hypothetical protein [Usitatibacter sp.]
MKLVRALMAACAALALPGAHAANALASDVSDMWWNASESGWGMNATQQANILFITLYVYSADGKAHWFVAPDMLADLSNPSAPTTVFGGTLYETTGPVFFGAFNPIAVNARMVGTAQFTYAPPLQGTLVYSVDGTSVTKLLRRENWAVNDPSGTYAASLVTRSNACSPTVTTTRNLGTATIILMNNLFTLATSGAGDNCTFSGTYSQEGHMGTSSGNFTCSASGTGPYTLSEIETGTHGFLSRFQGTIGGCAVYGNLSGTRTTVPQVSP